MLHEPWTWTALLIVLALKVIATLATTGTGAIGGVFTPTLFVGAAVGCLFGMGIHGIWPQMTSEPFAYAIVGMGAFLAAATNAPLMAILMIFEITLSYQVVLPLMLSCVIAYFIARNAEYTSMYEVTVRRNLAHKDRVRLAATRMQDLLKPAEAVVGLDASIEELTRMFLEHPVKYLYVVDEQKCFRGVVSLENVAADLASPRSSSPMKAVDYLLPDFHVLTPDMTLGEALELFMNFSGERLPVVDTQSRQPESQTILGVVHKTALLDTYVRIALATR